MRRFIRWLFTVALGGILVAIIGGVAAHLLIILAQDRGWVGDATAGLEVAMSAFAQFVTHPAFIAVAAFLAGATLGMWLDIMLKRIDSRRRDRAIEAVSALHNEIERVRSKLIEDSERLGSKGKVTVNTVNNVFAVLAKIYRLGIPTPISNPFGLEELVREEYVATDLYHYLSAVSPYIRDGNLLLAREIALVILQDIKEKKEQESSSPARGER